MVPTPRRPDEITTEWITHALREGGVLSGGPVAGVERTIIGQDVGFLSCVVRVRIDYGGSAPAGAPASVVVKLEPGVDASRSLGDELHAFEREIRFYREVAPHAPIRLARLYLADSQPPDHAIVMEDLSFATPGDQVAGLHPDRVMATARVMGRLQGRYWSNAALESLTWMPVTNRVELDYAGSWPSFVEHFGHVVDPDGLAVGERLREAAGWVAGEIERRPRTIVHTDLRADNLLFGAAGSPDAVLIVDWQLAIRSMGAFDIARLMGGSELPEERRGHHFDVLGAWHDALAAEGVRDYSWEAALRDFRLGVLSALCYPVHFHRMCLGGGRPRALMEAISRRLFTAAVEIDAGSVLP
jgi:hypothetical protein